MNSRITLRYVLSLAFLMVLVTSMVASAATVARMSTDELNSRLGEEGLSILDVRSAYHYGASGDKIKGSERVAAGQVSQWAANYDKGETIVLYCA